MTSMSITCEDGRAERLPMNTAANEYQAVVSPDDRWLAYVTDASGRDEVWVASFPSGQVKRQVSIDGGTSPQWTDRGRELAYLSERKWLTIRSFAGYGQRHRAGHAARAFRRRRIR